MTYHLCASQGKYSHYFRKKPVEAHHHAYLDATNEMNSVTLVTGMKEKLLTVKEMCFLITRYLPLGRHQDRRVVEPVPCPLRKAKHDRRLADQMNSVLDRWRVQNYLDRTLDQWIPTRVKIR